MTCFSKINFTNSSNSQFEQPLEKKWLSVALLVGSLVIGASALSIGLSIFIPHSMLPQWAAHAIGSIGQSGSIAFMATGIISFATSIVTFYCMRKKKDLAKSLESPHQSNIELMINNPTSNCRRFKIVTVSETQTITKVNFFYFLFRWLFVSQKNCSTSLRNALNQSIQNLNDSSHSNDEKWEIQAAKYNKFVQTAPLLKQISTEEEVLETLDCERENIRFESKLKENSDGLTQPIYQKRKWYYMKNQANHALEAFFIFAETQTKRLCRFVTLGNCCKYFSKNEQKQNTIYQTTEPTLGSHSEVSVQNIGHATLLFQIHGMNILTDPVFGGLSPVIYPRMTKPGLKPEELPPIDVILISHNHRDHCDLASLKKLVPHQPILLVPKGDFTLFKDLGFTNVQEHEWWEKTSLSLKNQKVDFFSLPSRHWSGRELLDTQQSLTCSWAFKAEGDAGAVYFRGDTANIPEKTMNEIKDFIKAPIMANFEPGGPNHTRRWMQSTHQSVLDSMLTHFQVSNRDTETHTYLMHHNTFELGTDRFDEANIIKEQFLTFLNDSQENNFKKLPSFVQKEYEKLKNKIGEIGVKIFTNQMRSNFHSPKIGERLSLTLNP